MAWTGFIVPSPPGDIWSPEGMWKSRTTCVVLALLFTTDVFKSKAVEQSRAPFFSRRETKVDWVSLCFKKEMSKVSVSEFPTISLEAMPVNREKAAFE
jgi:hypothetical protein